MNKIINSGTNPITPFRARDILCNKWVSNRELLLIAFNVSETNTLQVKASRPQDYILQRNIGKTDINNINIFEGDVVRGQYQSEIFDTEPVIGVVVWNSRYCGFQIKQLTETNSPFSDFYGPDGGMSISWDSVEVRGNQFDTPELTGDV
jgi:uncharacterized phage protein (TIGR01671 family)